MSNLPIIIIISLLIGSLICPLVSYFNRVLGRYIVIVASFIAFIVSILQIAYIKEHGNISYSIGNWQKPVGIEFFVDPFNAVIVVLVTFLGFLSTIYSLSFFKHKSRLKSSGYYSMLGLLICGLAGMSLTGDIFNLYVFLEITSISGYALIAMGGEKGVLSSFRYLLIGTIGASFYLLGIAFLYGETGTLNMQDMSGLVGPVLTSKTTLVAMVFFTLGFGIKMALFPLHGWQPEAYTNSHPGAAPMISGVMGKIPAYAMIRFFFFVFNAHSKQVEEFLLVVGVMSSMGIIYGSVKAILQTDLRRMLAYSSIAQVSYIGMGMAISGYYGLLGATLHILGHGLMKSSLFFSAGAIQYRLGRTKIRNLGQIQTVMPFTVTAMCICALSMVGIPPFTGFFSKWYLAIGAIDKHAYIYVFLLVISSLLNAIYFFNLIEKIFMQKKSTQITYHPFKGENVVPLSMKIPIGITAMCVILLGICNSYVVDFLRSTLLEVGL